VLNAGYEKINEVKEVGRGEIKEMQEDKSKR